MKKKITLLCLGVLLSLTMVNAYTNQTCTGNYTLEIIQRFNVSVNNSLETYEIIEDKFCNWGCDSTTNKCSPNPVNQYILIGIIVVGLFILLFYIIPKYT